MPTQWDASAACWDAEAAIDEVAAAAAVPKGEAHGIFVKLPPLLQTAPVAGKVYLDLGCGYGRTLLWVLQNLHPSAAIGIDVSEVMLAKAKGYATELGVNPRLMRASIDKLPLDPESVDFVYSSAVLLHLPKPVVRLALREAVRVLRPGGVALFESSFPG